MAATGKCLCGAVTFTAENIKPEIHACHCQMCQRWLGGPAMGIEVSGVEFAGSENLSVYESSPWAERGFCNKCGSSVYYRVKEPNLYILFAGSFDDQSAFRLTGEIYIDEKASGYDFAGEHQRLTGAEFLASIQPPE